MATVLGSFLENSDCDEFLVITFLPSKRDVQRQWKNNGLSANFLADYWSSFFSDIDSNTKKSRKEIKDAISYISNELLENIMKFNVSEADYSINLGVYLYKDEIRFYSKNKINNNDIDELMIFLSWVLGEDPNERFLQQLERNALTESEQSRLGFLTMRNNYNAELAWRFEPDTDLEKSIVTTMVRFSLNKVLDKF